MSTPENTLSLKEAMLNGFFSNFIIEFLVYSEWHLIEFMIREGHLWQHDHFPKPPTDLKEKGSIEAGVFLFLLNNPRFTKENKYATEVVSFLNEIITVPLSKISKDQYIQLDKEDAQLIYDDGSILSTANFCTYDQNWIVTIYNLWVTFINGLFYNDRYIPIPASLNPFVLAPDDDGQVLVSMTGDAGTGRQKHLLERMAKHSPACMIHMGDVYYAGTPSTTPPRRDGSKITKGYIKPNEEIENLIEPWKNDIPSFTMNSNHEMYSGGNGLFLDALTSPKFSNQHGCSMFAIKVADWFILGLDSAFYSEIDKLFMYGRLNGSLLDHPFDHNQQLTWIENMVEEHNIDPNKTIILTHHNAFEYTCDNTLKYETDYYHYFWKVLRHSLGGDPYAWYWGHIHNAIAYQSPLEIKYPLTHFKTNTYCRCIGNGAIPYGTAKALLHDADSSSKYQWFAGKGEKVAHTKHPGYGNLQFQTSNGMVESITETIYIGEEAAFTNQLFQSKIID